MLVVKGGTRTGVQKQAIDVFLMVKKMEVLDYPLLANNNIGAGCTLHQALPVK